MGLLIRKEYFNGSKGVIIITFIILGENNVKFGIRS